MEDVHQQQHVQIQLEVGLVHVKLAILEMVSLAPVKPHFASPSLHLFPFFLYINNKNSIHRYK